MWIGLCKRTGLGQWRNQNKLAWRFFKRKENWHRVVVFVHSKYSGTFQQFSIYVSYKPEREGSVSLIANCGILRLQMDSNMDGMVDFDEFVAATRHVHQLKENNFASGKAAQKLHFRNLMWMGMVTLLLTNWRLQVWDIRCPWERFLYFLFSSSFPWPEYFNPRFASRLLSLVGPSEVGHESWVGPSHHNVQCTLSGNSGSMNVYCCIDCVQSKQEYTFSEICHSEESPKPKGCLWPIWNLHSLIWNFLPKAKDSGRYACDQKSRTKTLTCKIW